MGRHRTPQEKLRIINEVRTGGQPGGPGLPTQGHRPGSVLRNGRKRLKEGGPEGLRRDAIKVSARNWRRKWSGSRE